MTLVKYLKITKTPPGSLEEEESKIRLKMISEESRMGERERGSEIGQELGRIWRSWGRVKRPQWAGVHRL